MPSETFVSAAEVEHVGKKSCLVHLLLPNKLQFSNAIENLFILKALSNSGSTAYFSVSYNDLEIGPAYKLIINGLYGKKLEIANKSIVSLSIMNTIPHCIDACVQPLSFSDWQIIQLHSNEVEMNLMNTIRVIWPGQIFPIWINNICIYMRTVQVSPESQCVLLVESSQIIVKDPATATTSAKEIVDGKIVASPSSTIIRSSYLFNIYQRFIKLIRYLWGILKKMTAAVTCRIMQLFETKSIVPINKPFLSEKVKESIELIPNDFLVLFRVEPFALDSKSTSNLSVTADQASTVVFHSPDIECTINDYESSSSQVFLVKITKLLSPKEKKVSNNRNDSEKTMKSVGESAIVRLNVHEISKFSKLINTGSCLSLKVSSFIRRQLNLPSTSIVQMQKVKTTPKHAKDILKKIVFAFVGDAASSYGPVDYASCFHAWLNTVSDVDHPLPLSVGSIIKFPCRYNLENDQTITNEFEFLLSDVEFQGAASTTPNEKLTFFLCNKDLKEVEVDFVSASTTSCKSIDEVDFNLPPIAEHSLCQEHKDIVKNIINLSSVALGLSPTTIARNDVNLNAKFVHLVGSKGVGKTFISMEVLRSLALKSSVFGHWIDCAFWRGKRPDVIKGLLSDVIDELKWRAPSALLLDNLDQLTSSSKNESDQEQSYDTQVASIFKHQVSKIINDVSCKVYIIVTSTSQDSLHSALRQETGCHLLNTVVEIPLPGPKTRVEILCELLNQLPLAQELIGEMENLHKKTDGFVAKDLVNVSQKIVHDWQVGKKRFGKSDLTVGGISRLFESYTPISLLTANLHEPVPLTWDDIGGLDDIRQNLTEQLMWPLKYSTLFQDCGLQLQTGILLYGEPGCGKTLIAGIVAHECELNFISVKGPELLNKYIGASEAAVRDLFIRASAAAPCILFFDEFDSIAPHRGHDTTGVTDRVVNQLLTHLDGVEPMEGVYVMAATSRPDLIDLALLRPGRLDNHLYLSLPTSDDRLSILKSLSRHLNLSDDVDLKAVAERCEWFSGADLKALMYDAQLEALYAVENAVTTRSQEISGSLSQENFKEIYSITGLACDEYLPSKQKENVVNEQQTNEIDKYGEIVYMPNLHTGIVDDIPEHIKHQADVWKKITKPQKVDLESGDEVGQQNMVVVRQCHIESCLEKAKPSLTKSERQKYKLIYEKFAGKFSGSTEPTALQSQRATMA